MRKTHCPVLFILTGKDGEQMNSAATVDNLISQWQTMGMTKAQLAVKIAEACMSWPYVWGGYGQYDTPANRNSYANRTSCPAAESACSESGPASSVAGELSRTVVKSSIVSSA